MKRKQTPIGNNFLPEKRIPELINLYKSEKNKKAAIRILCAINRKNGKTIKEISESLQIPITTVSDQLNRLNKNMKNIYDKKNRSRPTKLNKKQKKILLKIMLNPPENQGYIGLFWTTKMIQHYIYNNFKISFTKHGTRKMLNKMGFNNLKFKPNEIITQCNKKSKNIHYSKSKIKICKIDLRSSYWKYKSINNN